MPMKKVKVAEGKVVDEHAGAAAVQLVAASEQQAISKSQEKENETKEKQKWEQIDHAKEEGRKVLSKLKEINYSELLSDAYTEMDTIVDMCVRGISSGCIIEGSPGTGKTYRVLWRAKDQDYAYLDSFATPASLYIFLYKNKDKDVVIIDDVASMLDNLKCLAMLKGALWAIDKDGKGKNVRIVNYLTTKPLKDEHDQPVPDSFEMNARLIFITNKINKENEHARAVISRVHWCYVDIPREELLKILEQIAAKPFNGLSVEDRKEVLRFLVENTSASTEELNIRTLLKLFMLKQESLQVNKPDLWKILGLKMLKKNDLLVLVETLEKDDTIHVQMKVTKFQELTNKSRATYFRLKKQLEASKKKVTVEV